MTMQIPGRRRGLAQDKTNPTREVGESEDRVRAEKMSGGVI